MYLQRSSHLLAGRAGVALFGIALFSIAMGCKLLAGPGATQQPAATFTATPVVAEPPIQFTQEIPAPATEAPSQSLTLPAPGDPALALLPAARQDLGALGKLTRYILALQIDPSLRSFDGRARIEYINREDTALSELYFRLLPNGQKSYGNGSLSVSQALLDGEPASTELSLQDSVLKIDLPKSLPPGDGVVVEIYFSGLVPLDFGGNIEPAGYGIYNLSQGVLALSGWYPILSVYDEEGWNLDPVSAIGDSVYSDTALYTVQVCAPADLALVATGILMDQKTQGDASCAQWESGPTRDFFIIASASFEQRSQEIDGVTIHSYALPGRESASRQALDIAADALQVYNQKLGAYPFTELDMVDAPMRNALGVEFPSVILIADTMYEAPDETDFGITIAHEVAHQWWYSVVGNDVFDSPWLDEGLTTYSSSLYYEFGPSPLIAQGMVDFWQQRYERMKSSGKDGQITASMEYFEGLNDPSVYGNVAYIKAAFFFHELRQEIGDQAFFEALQRYYQENKYGIATPDDLLTAFEDAAGRSLEAFYAEWLYTPQP